MKKLIRSFSLPFYLVFSGCSGNGDFEQSFEPDDVGHQSSPLLPGAVPPVKAPVTPPAGFFLASPEFDIHQNTDHAWLHSATASQIHAKIEAGYRIVSVDVVSSTPLRFAATFVWNAGSYRRTGLGFDPNYTAAELESALADTSRRIVDLAPYYSNNTLLFAATWIANTGFQFKNYKVVRDASWSSLKKAATTGGDWRLLDLEIVRQPNFCTKPTGGCATPGPERFYGVFVENVDSDFRTQTFEFGDAQYVSSVLDGRLAEIEPSPANPDSFYFVVENASDGDWSYWGDSLFYDASADHEDSLKHAPLRFGARYSKLKPYQSGGQTYYAGILLSSADVPITGSSTEGNVTLEGIDGDISWYMKQSGTPGVVLAIAKNGKLVHGRGYGYSDLATARLAQPTDMFRIASVTKTIGTVATLRQIQDGLRAPVSRRALSLQTKVFGEVFDYTPPRGQTHHLGQITLEQLLQHRSCVVSTFDTRMTASQWIAAEAELVAEGVPAFDCAPGSVGDYRNTNYYVIRSVVAQVADDSFENYVKTTFTDPLGIQRLKPSLGNNSVHPGGFIEASYYQGVGWANRGGASASNNGDWVMTVSRHASGAYTASPLDFLRWFSTVDHSRRIYRSLDDTRFSWILDSGLGFSVKELASGVALSKGGLLPDMTHAEFFRRGDGISFIWISNGGVRKLSNALNRRFDADPSLPLRDVTYDYF